MISIASFTKPDRVSKYRNLLAIEGIESDIMDSIAFDVQNKCDKEIFSVLINSVHEERALEIMEGLRLED